MKQKIISYALMIIVFSLTIFQIRIAVQNIKTYNTDIRCCESNNIFTIQQINQEKGNMYLDPEIKPYSISQYAPFYYLIYSKISKLFLNENRTVYDLYIICRIISSFFGVLIMLSLFYIFKVIIPLDYLMSILLTLVAFMLISPWIYYMRPDALSVFNLLISLLLVLRQIKFGQKVAKIHWDVLLAGIFAFLAFFTKQDSVVLFLLISFYLLIHKRKIEFFNFTGGFVIGMLVGYLLYNPYKSPFILKNTIEGVKNGIDILFTFQLWKLMLKRYFIVFLVFAFVCIRLANNIKKQRISRFMLFIFLSMFCIDILKTLKFGAMENYFLFSIILGLILVGIFIKYSVQVPKLQIPVGLILLLLLINVFIVTSANIKNEYFGTKNLELYSNYYENEIISYLEKEFIKNPETYFISTARYLNNYFPNNCLFPQMEIVECCALPLKIYNYNELRKDILDGKLGYYITNGRKIDMLEPYIDCFQFQTELNGLKIFKNKYSNSDVQGISNVGN